MTLPRAGNLGGGGFMLIHLAAQTQKTVAIDFREARRATTKDAFLNGNGEADPFKSLYSGLGIGVPGSVAGNGARLAPFGSGKLPLAELVAPAPRLAHDGLPVDDDLADLLPLAAADPRPSYPSSKRIYLKARREPRPSAGDHIALDDLAATLDIYRQKGAAGFYSGPVAEKIVAAVGEAGGRMTLDDLARSPRDRALAGERNLSRPYHRLHAAALVGRRACDRDPQYPRGLPDS